MKSTHSLKLLLTTILGTSLMVGLSANAETTFKPNTPMEKIILSCFASSADDQAKAPKFYVTLTKDTSADFMTAYLLEGIDKTVFFYQTGKDVVMPQLEKNSIDFPLMTEATQSDNGVMKNTGYILIAPSSTPSVLSALLMAKGNVYPMACAKGEQLPQVINNTMKLPLK